MKKIKIIASVLCMCMLFVGCAELFRYILVDDTKSYTRVMMHELYNSEENIDILFVGSSHCYRALMPEIADEMFQKNTFNAGTSGQALDGSLVMIQEAVEENDVQTIYLEMYYDISLKEEYRERTAMTATYLISDYMRPSLRKLEYRLSASGKEHYVNNFILARRHWEKFFYGDNVFELITKKSTDDYKNYEYTYLNTEKEYYVGKGFVANDKVIPDGGFYSDGTTPRISTDVISDDWRASLLEIIEYCDKQEVELVLVSAPISNFNLLEVGDYDDYIDLINELIAGTGVKYYDFSLCKEEYFPNDEMYYYDTNHLNTAGAERFTKLFCEFFNGQIAEEDLFYDSYAEKVADMESQVFGVIVDENESQNSVTISSVANVDETNITYDLTVHLEDGKEVWWLGMDELPPYVYPDGEYGMLEIATYLDGVEQTRVEVEYGEEE